ncbi:MAG: UPF0271 protein [Porticoccaceae bacterium]|jgi:UPF0271 protein
MTDFIDLNADLGEGFGQYKLGDDDAMMEIVSSINLACGYHAGDPCIMANTISNAKEKGVAVGAHPSFRDLHGFGRREIHGIPANELSNLITYQIGALQAIARTGSYHLTHVRAHGSLGNMSDSIPEMAETLARTVQAVDSNLCLMTLPGSAADFAATSLGMNVVRQVFADRAYNDDGSLVSRRLEGAVIHDADIAADRIIQVIQEGFLFSINNKKVAMDIDTVVVHGDTFTSIKMAEKIRTRLENSGIQISPFSRTNTTSSHG